MKVDWEREKSWWDAKAPEEEDDLADRFDKEIQPEGAGARNRCGLIAVAEPKS